MSDIALEPGEWVEATASGGEVLRRRVVAVENGRVYLCTDAEFAAAREAERDPACVGFRPEVVRAAS